MNSNNRHQSPGETQRRKLIFLFMLGLMLLPTVIICCYLFISSYEEIKSFISPEKIYKTIFGVELEGSLFNERRYSIAKYVSIFVTFLQIALSFILIKYQRRVIDFLNGFNFFLQQKVKLFIRELKNLSRNEALLFLGLFSFIIIYKIFLMLHVPLNDDETRSYEYFVHQGFWVTCTYYPDTNNHIFYNLICIIFDQLINNSVLVMRIPVFIADVVLLLILFVFVKKHLNFQTALISLVLSSFMFFPAYFGAIGRGHILMTLFAFISILTVFNISDEENNSESNKTYKFLIFNLSSILGLFIVPTYIFVLTGLILFVIINSLRKFKLNNIPLLFIATSLIIIGAVFCYLPLFTVSGYETLLANRWTIPLSYDHAFRIFPVYCAEYLEYIIGLGFHVPRGYLIIIATGVLLLIIMKKFNNDHSKKWILLSACLIFIPLVAILVFKIFPPYRVFTFLHFVFYIAASILLSYSLEYFIQNKLMKDILYALIVLFFIGTGMYSMYTYI